MKHEKDFADRIRIRPITMDDRESLVRYANNKNVAANLRDTFPHPYLEKHAVDFIVSANDQAGNKLIKVIDLDGGLIGCIGGYVRDDIFEKSCEVGYWLAEPFWGKGVTTKAIKLFVPLLFEKFDVVRIYAEPYERNIASQRVLEKAGFSKESEVQYNIIKNGVIENSVIYSILKKR